MCRHNLLMCHNEVNVIPAPCSVYMVGTQLDILLLFWWEETSDLGEWETVTESLFGSPHCLCHLQQWLTSINHVGDALLAKGLEEGIQNLILLLEHEFLKRETRFYSFLILHHSYQIICVLASCNECD